MENMFQTIYEHLGHNFVEDIAIFFIFCKNDVLFLLYLFIYFLQERSSLTFLFCCNFFCFQTRSVYAVFFYIDFSTFL